MFDDDYSEAKKFLFEARNTKEFRNEYQAIRFQYLARKVFPAGIRRIIKKLYMVNKSL